MAPATPFGKPTSITSAIISTPASTAPAGPTPTCSIQDKTPDEPAACVCISGDVTTSLPILSVAATADRAASCAYTIIPGSVTNAVVQPSVTVFTSNCGLCSLVGHDNIDCAPISGCTPTTAPAPPALTMEVSNQNVSSGTWRGDDAPESDMFKYIQSQLTQICPPPARDGTATSCSYTDNFSHSVQYVDAATDHLLDGDLKFEIADSSYNTKVDRDNLIAFVAGAFATSVNEKNCYNSTYSGTCQTGPSENPYQANAASNEKCDNFSITQCRMADSIHAEFTGPGKPPTVLWVEAKFEQQPPKHDGVADFVCQFVTDLLEAAELLATPELQGVELPTDLEFEGICKCVASGGTECSAENILGGGDSS